MSRTRFSSFMAVAGMLLLFACTVLPSSLVSQWKQSNGPIGFDKLSATVNLAADPTGSSGLSLVEAERLSDIWGAPVAYSARMPGRVEGGGRSVSGDLIGVGGDYDRFTNLWLQRGDSFSAGAIQDHARVAIISSEIAERLFHSRDVVGLRLRMMNADFEIVGVFAKRNSLLDWMTDDGTPDLLIPITTMIEFMPQVKIQNVNFQASSASAVSGVAEASSALTEVGKPSSAFVITNSVQSSKWITQKPAILLFVCGLAVIGLFVRMMAMKMKEIYRIVRQERQMKEWTDVWKTNRRALSMSLALIAAALAGILLMWLLIRFPFYMPADSIPGELIDWTFYRDKALEIWKSQIGRMGYVASADEIMQNRVNKLISWLFGAGIVVGLPLFMLGVREWGIMKLPASIRFIRICLYMLPAAAITWVLAWWAGIPTLLEWKEISVLFSMFALYALTNRGQETEGGTAGEFSLH